MKKPLIPGLTAILLGTTYSAETYAGDLTIRRDSYGMPHIYADTVYDLYFGYGYARSGRRISDQLLSSGD